MKRRSRRKPSALASVAELFPPPGRWTEEDYFALPDTNRYVELSEGRLIMPPHPTRRHQVTVGEIYVRLQTFVRSQGLGWVFLAPLPVRLWPGKIREPDVFFIAREHADRIREQVCGVPDLVVEVLSPQTRRTDRSEKFYEYARAGVTEYWLVDPDRRTVEVFALQEGAYELVGRYGPGETIRSHRLTGLEIPVDEIFGHVG